MDTTLVTDLTGNLLHFLQLLVDDGDLILEVGVSVHLVLAVGVMVSVHLLRVISASLPRRSLKSFSPRNYINVNYVEN